MWKYMIILVVICGIHVSNSSRQSSQQPTQIGRNGIKKNEVGANGRESPNLYDIRNPVLEYLYLMRSSPESMATVPGKGTVREIRHSQTLLIPDIRSAFSSLFQPLFVDVQTYPATAILINSYNSDGTLKSSLTHFQPDLFAKLQDHLYDLKEGGKKTSYNNNLINADKVLSNILGESQLSGKTNASDHILGLFRPTLYSAVSSIVEYEKGSETFGESVDRLKNNELESEIRGKLVAVDSKTKPFEDLSDRGSKGKLEKNTSEVTQESDTRRNSMSLVIKQNQSRSTRDTTSVLLKSRLGDRINITVEEPQDVNRKLVKIGDSDLVFRKGGIAIAGPGGAAVAYTGGTAIVGPYGTVYKSPEGTAILGPYGKIVNITDDMNFEEIIKMHKEQEEGRNPLPVVRTQTQGHKFRNFQNFFAYKTNRPLQIELTQQKPIFGRLPNVLRLKEGDLRKKIEATLKQEFRRVVQDTPVEEKVVQANETSLIFHPKSKAEAGRNGIAVSAPVSHAILFPGQKASIFFEPESVASAGPSGFAHAHSDLLVSYVNNGTNVKPEIRQ